MKNKNNKYKEFGNNEHFINHQIMASEVLCIDQNNKNLGLMPIHEALALAEEVGLDLVQMSYNSKERHPTCKILDYSKFKYENHKRKKAAIKNQKNSEIKIKEIKFKTSIADHDFHIKAKQVNEFLKDNYRVKLTIFSKGRQSTHKNLITDTVTRFLELIQNSEKLSESYDMDGKYISIILGRKEDKQNAK